MNTNVFKRVETKYLLTDEEYKTLMKKIDKHLMKDKYYKSTICNIYFDTDDYDVINKSLEKPVFKQKIRLRSYNVPSLEDDVFFEIKGKYDGVVFKRREKIKLIDYYNYINDGKIPSDKQIIKEIDYLIKNENLKPKIMLSYDRLSYYDKDNKNFRITFDQNIRSREEDLNLEYGDAGKLYFNKPTYIMELKSLGAMPLWFTNILTKLKIYPKSFSKYGSIYKQMKGEMINV